MKREFKYYPEDFGELTVKVLHMDLFFDMYPDHMHSICEMRIRAREDIDELSLDAKRLEIEEVSCPVGCSHEYHQKTSKLVIKFKRTLKKDEELVITTRTVCRPTKNILEGLYYDETPEGAPPTMITQCQQWGFQRIVPCLDDMTAKCTYTTSIRADKRYTDIITNGDLVQKRKDIGDNRVEVVYENKKTPMAPYLFYLGVGTYDSYRKELEYPDSDKIELEMLVPVGTDGERVEQALDVLHDCVMWVHLFTGPDTYRNKEKSGKIWELLKRREETGVRENIKELIRDMRLGYKYTAKVYREIGMQNSDYGGMENVGNTTITTNRMLPFTQMTDPSFEYMVGVKVHEYYHNLNGSEVTGWSPFEIWLNEAVTVHIENDYESFVFGEDYERLHRVLMLTAPSGGTFALDSGPASMPVEPDGFNDTNELITGITYVKAPEVVRMIETMIGKEAFVKGLHAYHEKFSHGNAKRADWRIAMEEASGIELSKFMKLWLKQTGYPTVRVSRSYKDGRLTLKLTQKGPDSMTWEFPFELALFDREGKVLEERTIQMKEREHTTVFDVEEPAFVSMNRRMSFYGKVIFDDSEEELFLQVRKDNDVIGRYFAWAEILDREKMRLLKDPDADVDPKIVELYYELISDSALTGSLGGRMLVIFESVEDESHAHRYDALYRVKERIKKAVAAKYKKELIGLYDAYAKREFKGSYVEQMIAKIKPRQIKNICLKLLATLDTPDTHDMIRKQFNTTQNATSKIVAFKLILNSSMADKMELLESYEEEAKTNLVSWETFLRAVASTDSEDALDMVKKVEESSAFRIEQANDQRALFAVFANNKKRSLLTDEAREFLTDRIITLADINEYNTNFVVRTFANIDKMERKHQVPLVKCLISILEALSPEETPSVYTTAKRILMGSPNAVAAYEKEHGKISVVD